MAFFGFRPYPTPILKPVWPFMAASAIVYYGVARMQYYGVRSEEYAKDPKNPYGACHPLTSQADRQGVALNVASTPDKQRLIVCRLAGAPCVYELCLRECTIYCNCGKLQRPPAVQNSR